MKMIHIAFGLSAGGVDIGHTFDHMRAWRDPRGERVCLVPVQNTAREPEYLCLGISSHDFTKGRQTGAYGFG